MEIIGGLGKIDDPENSQGVSDHWLFSVFEVGGQGDNINPSAT